jgi:hypothetical protein
MIPQGRYKARCVEAALSKTSTGREQVAALLEVTQGEHAGEQLTWYGHFTDKTTERTFESLRHLGWEGDDLTDLRGIDANEVSVVIEHEEGQDGRTYPRVKWINGNGGGLAVKERLDDAAARAFAARMKGAAIASRSKNGGAPKPSNGQRSAQHSRAASFEEAPPFDDEGVPF